MFESTADKVLRVLIANEDKPTVGEKFSAVKATLPNLTDAEINSVIAELNKQGLITTIYGDNKLISLRVQPYALARLTTKREVAVWNVKWDVAKIALGYALGFLSAWLLK